MALCRVKKKGSHGCAGGAKDELETTAGEPTIKVEISLTRDGSATVFAHCPKRDALSHAAVTNTCHTNTQAKV